MGYSGDGGPATQAHLDSPNRVILGSGNLYIADTGNNCIRKVEGVNSAPVLSDPGAQSVNEGQVLAFTVTADSGHLATIAATNLPPGASFVDGMFTWRPTYNEAWT